MNTTRFGMTRWMAGLVLISLVAGCHVNFSMTDGYRFTRQGLTSETDDGGDLSESVKQIRIVNRFGPIDIQPVSDGAPSNWTWKGKTWSPTQEQADRFAAELLVDVQTSGDTQTWTLLMPEPDSELTGVESRFEFRLAPGIRVEVDNRHGDVSIGSISEMVEADCAFGDLRLTHSGPAKISVSHGDGMVDGSVGGMTASGSHGSLMIKNIEGELVVDGSHTQVSVDQVLGDVRLETSFDDLLVNHVTGRATLTNAHGDIQASIDGDVEIDNQFGEAEVMCSGSTARGQSSHGGIKLSMTNPAFQRVDLKTDFDDLLVTLPVTSNPALNMETTFGETLSEFSESGSGGGPQVKLRNAHGDIEVRSMAVPAPTGSN